MPPPKKLGAGRQPDTSDRAQIVLGARPWVHALYCCVILAVHIAQFLGPVQTGTETIVDGWGGAAGSVGIEQSQCPTWSRPRELTSNSPDKGNTVISIDPRCFRNPFMNVHTFDTELSPACGFHSSRYTCIVCCFQIFLEYRYMNFMAFCTLALLFQCGLVGCVSELSQLQRNMVPPKAGAASQTLA